MPVLGSALCILGSALVHLLGHALPFSMRLPRPRPLLQGDMALPAECLFCCLQVC